MSEEKNYIGDALKSLSPDAQWCVRHTEDGDVIEWMSDDIPQPTDAEIEAKKTELKADYDAKQYQRDREYPSIGDQLDMQYWDAVNGTTTWKDAIAQVKADNPKPE